MNPPDAIDARASALMQQGIGRLDADDPDAATDALACFDAALALRRQLPLDAEPRYRYGLAACWLNRAEALGRLPPAEHAEDAVQASDEAIALLRTLALDDDPRYRRRLAIAYQNRGVALQAADASRIGESAVAFDAARSLLEDPRADLIDDRSLLLAAVSVNLANVSASVRTSASDAHARATAQRALDLLADHEWKVANAAETGLKARHVLCRLVARRLVDAGGLGADPGDDVHEATDLVDAGLTLARAWERKGHTRLRGLAVDLFRFGTGVYGRYQPHFVREFVVENMDPAHSSPGYVAREDMRAIADAALRLSALSVAFRRPAAARV